MKPQTTIDPLEERLNKPIEIIEKFRELLPSNQLDVYQALFSLFSLSAQNSLLATLEAIHYEAREAIHYEAREDEDEDD